MTFITECFQELKKVVWPTWEETKGATWVVVVSLVFLSLFIFLVDKFFLFSMNRLFS